MRFNLMFQKQTPMRQVVTALLPAFLGSVYFFGWVSAVMVALSMATCILTEWMFVRNTTGKVSEAVLVTAFLFALTLPPTVPLWMIVLGGMFGVVFGKMAFGGFGANVFNPAMVARAFLYITFPVQMTNRWIPAASLADFPGGFSAWRYAAAGTVADSITAATATHAYKAGAEILPSTLSLFLGQINGRFQFMGATALIGGGSLGETSALLLILGGAYLLIKKVSRWRLVAGFFSVYLIFQTLLYVFLPRTVFDPVFAVLSGGIMLGGFFMVTDPVSSAKTSAGQWIYSGLIAVLAILIRSFSLFAGGLMFAVLLGNMFAPLIDVVVKGTVKDKKQESRVKNQEKNA
jgi:Na+-transporting NADH:ubiquinone oxidoreductase subunit B